MPWGSPKRWRYLLAERGNRGKSFHLTEDPELSVQRLLGSTQPTDILYAAVAQLEGGTCLRSMAVWVRIPSAVPYVAFVQLVGQPQGKGKMWVRFP